MLKEKSPEIKSDPKAPLTSASIFPGGDYFSPSLRGDGNRPIPATSLNTHRVPSSPIGPLASATLSSSNSSRGSWSSLFNTGSVRQFMSGVQDTFKDGLTPMGDILTTPGAPIPVPAQQKNSQRTTPARYTIDPSHSTKLISKSWDHNALPGTTKAVISFSSAGHVRRATYSLAISPKVVIPEKKVTVFDKIAEEKYVFSTRYKFSMSLIMRPQRRRWHSVRT